MVAVQYQATLQFMRMGRVRRCRRRARVPAPGGYAPSTHMARRVDGELYNSGTRGALRTFRKYYFPGPNLHFGRIWRSGPPAGPEPIPDLKIIGYTSRNRAVYARMIRRQDKHRR